MKKQYEAPKAEKVVFDYTESVAACYSTFNYWPCWCNSQQGSNEEQKKGTVKTNGFNNDPNGQFFKCLSTDHFNC